MKRIEYYILVIILITFMVNNRIVINKEINNKNMNEIYCSNNIQDYEEYKKYSNDNKFILTKVKYRDIYKYKNEITIYKGYNDGIKEENGVINDTGLVGIVIKSNKETSVVRLITNNDSNISVKINNNYGILKYNGSLYIDDLVGKVSNGDLVYTSGLGSIMENILVGSVVDVTNGVIKVESIVDMNTINYLYVIEDNND